MKETDENFLKIILYHELGYYLEYRRNPRDLKTFLYGEEKEKQLLIKSKKFLGIWENIGNPHLLKQYPQVP